MKKILFFLSFLFVSSLSFGQGAGILFTAGKPAHTPYPGVYYSIEAVDTTTWEKYKWDGTDWQLVVIDSTRLASDSVLVYYQNGSQVGSDTIRLNSSGGTPGGSDKQVQFNDGGSFGGNANFIFDKTAGEVGIGTNNLGARLVLKNKQEPSSATVVNEDFTTATNWTYGAGWTDLAGYMRAILATGDLTYIGSFSLTVGKAYEVSVKVSNYTGGTLTIHVGNANVAAYSYNATNVRFLLPTGGSGLKFSTSGFTGDIDDVIVKEISNPATALLAGKLSGSNTAYSQLVIPNSTSIFLGGGGVYTTGTNNVANGYQALFANTTGNNNTANGFRALYYNTTGGANTATGSNALFANTTGTNNVANGYQALFANTTGNNNTANGFRALYYNTTGGANTATGGNALFANTTGTNNVANGYQALFANTTGNNNTANGFQALYFNTTGTYNTANGFQALYSNTTGTYNTANGYQALYYNTTGSNNTANGYQAGRYYTGSNVLTKTDQSIFIGTSTKAKADSSTNEIVIGYNATGLGNNTFILGNNHSLGSLSAQKVGVNKTNADYTLDVNGDVKIGTLNSVTPTALLGDNGGVVARVGLKSSDFEIVSGELRLKSGASNAFTQGGNTFNSGETGRLGITSNHGLTVLTNNKMAIHIDSLQRTTIYSPTKSNVLTVASNDGNNYSFISLRNKHSGSSNAIDFFSSGKGGGINLGMMGGEFAIIKTGYNLYTIDHFRRHLFTVDTAVVDAFKVAGIDQNGDFSYINVNSTFGSKNVELGADTIATIVKGTLQVDDLTATPTKLTGTTAAGIAGDVAIGTGLSLSGGTLSATGSGGSTVTANFMHTASMGDAVGSGSNSVAAFVVPAELDGWELVEVTYRTGTDVGTSDLDVQLKREKPDGTTTNTAAGTIPVGDRYVSKTGLTFTVNTGDMIYSNTISGSYTADGLTVTLVFQP